MANEWQWHAYAYSGTNLYAEMNHYTTASKGMTKWNITKGPAKLGGTTQSHPGWWNGIGDSHLDEFRISDIYRSEDWLEAEYLVSASNSTWI